MKKECLYTLKKQYRDDLNIYGYRFGRGEKAACIVGSIRGNEVQQLYICSQLVKALKRLEEKGAIVEENEILVIPSVLRTIQTSTGCFPAIMQGRPHSGLPPDCLKPFRDIIMGFSSQAFIFREILSLMCG